MDVAQLQLILSSFTAIAAIVAPVLTAIINARSAARIRRIELNTPAFWQALEDATEKYYSLIHREAYDLSSKDVVRAAPVRYKNFAAASYRLISLMPDRGLRNRLGRFLKRLSEGGGVADAKTDEIFQQLIFDIAASIRP